MAGWLHNVKISGSFYFYLLVSSKMPRSRQEDEKREKAKTGK
jgi:hypothetical protein